MNDTLVRNWNSRVRENDIVIFLGDFAFKKTKEQNVKKWLSLLKGQITFIKGNHDLNNTINTRTIGLRMHMANRFIYCTHHPENYLRDCPLNLVGHVHKKWKIQRRGRSILVNVGVDVWNFSPVDINEILKAVKEFKEKEKQNVLED